MNFFGVDVVTYLAAIITVLFFAAPTKWFLGKVWNGIKSLVRMFCACFTIYRLHFLAFSQKKLRGYGRRCASRKPR